MTHAGASTTNIASKSLVQIYVQSVHFEVKVIILFFNIINNKIK